MSDEPTGLKTFRLYWGYWMRHRWLFIVSLFLGPAYILQYVVSPLFIAKIIGQLAAHHSASWHYILYAGVSLGGGISLWWTIDKFCSSRLDNYVLHDMYADSFHQLLKQEYNFFADNFTGSLVTQTNRFVKSYELFHVVFFLGALGQFCGVLVAIGIMLAYNVQIGALIGLLWLISIGIVCYLVKRRIPHRRLAARKDSQLTGELADALTNATTIKTFAAENIEEARYGQTNKERGALLEKSWQLAINNTFIVQILCAVLQIVLLIFGIRAIENHSISIATYLLFQVYILVIINNVNSTTLTARQIEGILGDSHEMALTLDRTPEVRDTDKPETLKITASNITFKNITFAYTTDTNDNQLFHDFSLTIQPGERIGLVGPSGSGKTTITKLLLRFMDVQNGTILIGDQDIRNISQADLHRVIAYVPQEPLLFHRSLYENISYGNNDASKKEVMDASKFAYADDFIRSLPDGYDTLVGERGIKLSGGQRQRIAIARAILKNAPILVLDEATSALDSESEKYIQKALWKLMDNKTSLVIAHRLSTIKHLDRIVVLDEGRVVEEGSHEQLLRRGELYAKLWAHQSGGFLKDDESTPSN